MDAVAPDALAGLLLDRRARRRHARDGGTLWAGGSLRARGREAVAFQPGEVAFTPTRHWRSPRTGTSYPVAMEVRIGEGKWKIEPLLDDQELDARASTGTNSRCPPEDVPCPPGSCASRGRAHRWTAWSGT